MSLKLPGSFRGDGLANHRMHDILLACGTTLFGALIDIVLEGYDSLAAPNSSVRSLGMPPPGRKAKQPGHVAHGPPRSPPVTAHERWPLEDGDLLANARASRPRRA